MITKSEIESLIFLLDDPDPVVQTGVRNRLNELGEDAVPLLDQYRAETVAEDEKEFINNIIYNITVGAQIEEFSELLDEGVDNGENLERAVLLLSKFATPTLRIEEYSRKLDNIAQQIGTDIAYTPSLREKMQIMLQFVFRELRFRGDSKNYHHPDNALLDRVIDRRKGLPIMLSLIVIFLARRLNLPFYGVNMPIHFMLIYQTHNEGVLIDPFDGGTIVTYDQCYYFLKKNGIEPRPEHLKRADETDILARCIRNLIQSFAKQKQDRKVKDLRELLQLVELRG
jgi:regulator of sirC expression with transglutaminase-like and TPR domain